MAKKTEKIHYLHEGVMQDVKAIYRKHRKRCGRSKYLLSVDATVRKGEDSLPVRLVFVRNRKDWLVLVTTDMSLTEEEVIRIYGKRWGDRGVLQGVQELFALREGLPCTLIRCDDCTCFHRVYTVHVSGGGATRIQG